jgi:hypothetical protein
MEKGMKPKEQKPWTVERVVGHLVEMRVNRLDSTDEVKRFTEAIVKVGSVTPEAVFIVDLRTPVIFAQPVAAALIELMTKANRVRRKTAILLAGEHAVFGMQLGRLVRQVGDPKRQTFTDPEEMLNWLEDTLTDAEAKRAKIFVGSYKGLSSAS